MICPSENPTMVDVQFDYKTRNVAYSIANPSEDSDNSELWKKLPLLLKIQEAVDEVFPEAFKDPRSWELLRTEKQTEYLGLEVAVGSHFKIRFYLTFAGFLNINPYVTFVTAEFYKELLDSPREVLDCTLLHPENWGDFVGWLSVIKNIYTQITSVTCYLTEHAIQYTGTDDSTTIIKKGVLVEIFRDEHISKIRNLFAKNSWDTFGKFGHLGIKVGIDEGWVVEQTGLTFRVLTKEQVYLCDTLIPCDSILEFSNNYTYRKRGVCGDWEFATEQDTKDIPKLIEGHKIVKFT